MTQQHGERRRLDRLMSEDYVQQLGDLDDDTLLADRDAAVQEEADLSYVRRLLQGRLDLLRFEQGRRSGAAAGETPVGTQQDDAELVRALARVLTSGPRRGGQSTGPSHVASPPVAAGEPSAAVGSGRRAAEAAVSDVRVSDPHSLDDEGLAAALERFESLESNISASRHRIQTITDALTAEVARRVEAGRLAPETLQPSI